MFSCWLPVCLSVRTLYSHLSVCPFVGTLFPFINEYFFYVQALVFGVSRLISLMCNLKCLDIVNAILNVFRYIFFIF